MLRQALAAIIAIGGLATPALAQEPETGTASVNGIEMYYEVQGDGPPLILLHGAYGSAADWAALAPTFAETHKVIAVDLQAHGRTTDRDTPITYAGMADDVAALMEELKVESAAVYGYSMGGSVALQVAIRHPEKVNRLVVNSSAFNYDAYPDTFYAMIEGLNADVFAGTPMETTYLAFGRSKEEFVNLVGKLRALDLDRFAWPEEDIAAIKVPTLLIFGDADVVELEHAVKMYRLMGGITDGDTNGLPKVQLAVLPGTTHINAGYYNPETIDYLKHLIPKFLAQNLPAPPQMPF